jgi:inner membrane protein
MRLFFKLAIVFGLTVLILIPLAMVREVIAERQVYRQQAIETIARSAAGAQSFVGPVLVVPYVETVEVEEAGPMGVRKVLRDQPGQWTFFPATLSVTGKLRPETRNLGLHRVRVYDWRGHAAAQVRATIPVDADPARPRRIGRPYLAYGIADVRGLRGSPKLTVDGRAMPVVGGFGARDGGGLHVRLPAPRAGQVVAIATTLDFALGGTESLALVPIAGDNPFSLDSTWQHPRFGGSFLPTTRTIGDKGFAAQWGVSSIASNAQAQFLAGKTLPGIAVADRTEAMATSDIDAVAVALVEPVNVYLQAERATKYGILFVLLTFVGFFMFELIKQLPIHPIQYGLVGLALAIFFLLLVSLSEHIAFGIAYIVSAAACIGLLGFYLSAVLHSVARGMGFAAMLAALYAALYGLLVSEDNALVLGACLLFGILAAIMVITRKVDWYALSSQFRTT